MPWIDALATTWTCMIEQERVVGLDSSWRQDAWSPYLEDLSNAIREIVAFYSTNAAERSKRPNFGLPVKGSESPAVSARPVGLSGKTEICSQ